MVNLSVRKANLRIIVNSASFFSVPGPTSGIPYRRCLLSLSMLFTPTKTKHICDFALDFAFEGSSKHTWGRDAPNVVGWQFLSLEKQTAFFETFGQMLKEEPCNFGADWAEEGYADLFSELGEYCSRDRMAWCAGYGSPTLKVRGEGLMGIPAGLVTTLPLCVLLEYRNAAPPMLSMNFEARVGVQKKRKRQASRLIRASQIRYSDRDLGGLDLPLGPRLSVIPGDRAGDRSLRWTTLLRQSRLLNLQKRRETQSEAGEPAAQAEAADPASADERASLNIGNAASTENAVLPPARTIPKTAAREAQDSVVVGLSRSIHSDRQIPSQTLHEALPVSRQAACADEPASGDDDFPDQIRDQIEPAITPKAPSQLEAETTSEGGWSIARHLGNVSVSKVIGRPAGSGSHSGAEREAIEQVQPETIPLPATP